MKTTDIGFERFEEDFQANPNTMLVVPNAPKNKPIKIVFEDGIEVIGDGNDIEIKRKLSDIEVKNFLTEIFDSINIGILDCSNDKALIEAFAKIGIALRDENGDFRKTGDVLKDMSEKYEQLYGQNNE